MVSEKMGLPYYRRRRRGRGRRRFSVIYCGKNIQSNFMKFSEFVYLVKDYGCANFRNQQSFLTRLK